MNVIEAPENVLSALCESFKIHLQPVAIGNVAYKQVDERREISKYLSNGYAYEIRREPRTGRVSTVLSKPLKQPKLFVESGSDSTAKEALLKEIRDYRTRLQRNADKNKDLIVREQKQKTTFSSIEQRYASDYLFFLCIHLHDNYRH